MGGASCNKIQLALWASAAQILMSSPEGPCPRFIKKLKKRQRLPKFYVARQIKSIFNKNCAFSETSMKFGM